VYVAVFVTRLADRLLLRLKANVEWLEVQMVVPSKWLVEQGRITTLDCDRQPLETKRPFSAVTRCFT